MKTFSILFIILSCCMCGITAISEAPVNRYKIRDEDQNVCALVQVAATFHIDYQGLTDPKARARFIIPRQAEVNKELSSCSSTETTLVVEFYEGYNLTVTYRMVEYPNGVKKFTHGTTWTLGYTLDKKRFPDAAEPGSTVVIIRERNYIPFFDSGTSFHCESTLQFEWFPFTSNFVAMTFTNYHMQPFEVENGKYGPEHVCRADLNLEAPVMNYEVLDDDNNVCILAQFALSFHVNYYTTTRPDAIETYFLVPEDATVNQGLSSCSDTFAKLVIEFYEGYNFTSTFELADDDMYMFADWTLGYTLDEAHFPNAVDAGSTVLTTAEVDWSIAQIGESFRCEDTKVIFTIQDYFPVLRDTHVQAFGIENGAYGPANHCEKALIT